MAEPEAKALPRMCDSVTYAQVAEVLRAVSDAYANGGVTGALSAPAEEILQAAWTEFRNL